jgi:type I restriction enzyme M protein
MLDQETKQRIDNLRDTLVGKVPDPKSQVEQIMISMIYKFMNDMDNESTKLGGKRSFFVDDFEKYSWENLFDAKVSGAELVELYSTAVESMEENPNIPTLFRDIFKNAYIPYKDPETLRLFLSQINEFEYSYDSEQLGDAFEHILNTLSSQGDAGQFRTPRHIIDFIVEILDPKKNETILDPASGTSGFLISAYKHIIKTDTEENKDNPLSESERKTIMKNINGYDISPDMVRIGLANMYLHGFDDPNVFEYDALSSEDRWNEYYDVILANPPFMTPKGGIRPHNKFGLKSNRAEVLFVDYILSHLKPKGRAGIIVPEGIIFQSGKAYKELRKKLIENGLIGVISLPSGVFNPYSGVKTSILLIDKTKQVNEIIFAGVNSDGYSLGSNRNKVDNNDLPLIKDVVKNNSESELVVHIEKENILENENILLTVNSYTNDIVSSKFPLIKLGDVCKFQGGSQPPKSEFSKVQLDNYDRFIQIRDFNDDKNIVYIPKSEKNKYCEKDDILIGRYGASVGRICTGLKGAYNVALIKTIPDEEKITKAYSYQVLKSSPVQNFIISNSKRAAQAGINPKVLGDFQIPLPPLEKQQEIVDEIEQYQKVIDGARQVVENFTPSYISDDKWIYKEIGEVVKINPPKSEVSSLSEKTKVTFLPMEDLNENDMYFEPKKSKKISEVYKGYTYFKDEDVLLAKVTPCFENGKAGIARNLLSSVGFGSSEYIVLRPGEEVLSEWVYMNVITKKFRKEGVESFTGTSGLRRVPKSFVTGYKIPIPDIEEQKEIVNNVNKQYELISMNKTLIKEHESKINSLINKLYS